MHMADALISPAVGGTLWGVTSGTIAWCSKKVKAAGDERLIPMMGVLGAFIFTAQMINFSVPGTGSSGHLGGGLILTILLGPYAAFLVIASVLTVQSLFFADGGLLALGCNIFNMGIFPAFIAYPLIYRPIARGGGATRAWLAAILAAVAGLQMGAFAVVLETKASGISALAFSTFCMLMQPIHLAIGIVEGLATATVVGFVSSARPEALAATLGIPGSAKRLRPVIWGLLIAAIVIGGTLSWFASSRPDGLEWAIEKVTGRRELAGPKDDVHQLTARLQENTAILPDYGFKTVGKAKLLASQSKPAQNTDREGTSPSRTRPWPAANAGTSLSGVLGGFITLIVCGLIGCVLKLRRRVI